MDWKQLNFICILKDQIYEFDEIPSFHTFKDPKVIYHGIFGIGSKTASILLQISALLLYQNL